MASRLRAAFILPVLAAASIAAGAPGVAPAHATTFVPNARYDAETVKRFAKELAPFVKQLTREVTMWHYAHRTKIGAAEHAGPRDEAVIKYAQSKPDYFWKAGLELGNVAGNGLYFARDPIQSWGYGGPYDPGLIEMNFRKGLRVLDVEKNPQLVPSLELQKMLAKHGCNYSAWSLKSLTSSSSFDSCQEIFKLALRALDVSLVSYDYGHTSTLEGCARTAATFVVIDDQAIEPKDVTYLGKDLSKATPEQITKAWRISKLAILYSPAQDSFEVTKRLQPVTAGFKPSPKDEQDFSAWKKSNLVGCDGNPSSIYEPIPADGVDSDKHAVALINGMLKEVTNFEKVGLLAGCPKSQWISIQSATVTAKANPASPSPSPGPSQDPSRMYASNMGRAKLAKFCNGVDVCNYETAYMAADLAVGNSEITATWTCVGGDEKKTKTATADYGSGVLMLTCP